ncbi:MAG: PKD domain-containing protein [Myxococcales bacterium]|nr:PKD domain-containing protein [Myxococcales bacterium]
MRSLKTLTPICCALLLPGLALAQTLTVAPGTTVNVTSPATYTAVTVQGTLNLDAALTVNGNMTVVNGGLVTHSRGNTASSITVSGTLTVDSGGLIDVTGKGLLGGNAAGNPYGCTGATIDPASGLQVGGAGAYTGGSYGGFGGRGFTQVYGSQDNPFQLGGGGGCGDCGHVAGNGGGRLQITAGTLQLDGAIRANGANPVNTGCGNWPGAGAGGTINLTLTNFSGAGSLSAVGGNSGYQSGGGGGGRIRVSVSGTRSFTGPINAAGGGGGYAGSTGTVAIVQPTANSLHVQGGIYLLTGTSNFTTVTLGPGGTLSITGPATVTNAINVVAGSTVQVNSTQAFTSLTLAGSVAGTVVLNQPVSWTQNVTLSGTIEVNQPLTVSNLTVATGGLVTHAQGITTSALSLTGTLDVQFGGNIDVSARGLLGGNRGGPCGGGGANIDPTNSSVTCYGAYGGGSHGGAGGRQSAGTVNGSQDNPLNIGGGAGGGDCGHRGGNGGGKVVITAGTLRVDGSIKANGEGPLDTGCGNYPGGGAGGSINAQVGTFAGGGAVQAAGASTPGGNAGGGGGGRILISASTNTFTGSLSVAGGNGTYGGSSGTVKVLNSSSNALYVAGGNYSISASSSLSSVVLGSGGVLAINGAATVTQPIDVVAGSTVQLNDSGALQSVTLSPAIAGKLSINAPISWPANLSVPGTLEVNKALSVNNVTVVSGGNVTHSQGADGFALNLPAAGTIDVQFGGSIEVSSKGLLGGNRLGPCGGNGASIDPTTGQVVCGTGVYAGGSHGGAGGRMGPASIYGTQDTPRYLGAGGGGGDCGWQGGNGGGMVVISAGTLKLNGALRANGGDYPGNCNANVPGGGAGGTVAIQVDNLQGVGPLSANGGDSSQNGGGGAGGRIRVTVAQTNTFTGIVTAQGGVGGYWGGAGSSAIETTSSSALNIAGAWYNLDASRNLSTVSLGNLGTLTLSGAATVTNPITVIAGSAVLINDSSAFGNLSLSPSVAGTVVVNAQIGWPASATLSGTLEVNKALSIDNLTIAPGGLVTHGQGANGFALSLPATGTLEVQPGASVDVSAKGLLGGNRGGPCGGSGAAIDPSSGLVVCAVGAYVGGSHGSVGGRASSTSWYDSQWLPAELGSAGGAGDCGHRGGNGGGKVSISAGTVRLDGTIRANGQGPLDTGCGNWPGAGAGGAVYIFATTFTGTGGIQATGAASGNNSGSGSGGRIRVAATTNSFTGGLNAAGGQAGWWGGAGTAGITASGSQELTVRGGVFLIGTGTSYSQVNLGAGAQLHVNGTATATQPVAVPAGAELFLDAVDALTNLAPTPAVAGTLHVNAPVSWSASPTVTGVMNVNGALSLSGLTVAPGGLVTHARGVSKFDLDVSGTLEVQAGGAIDATGKGLLGGNRGGPTGGNGETIDPASGAVVSGPGNYTGGSHGGAGGRASASSVYDSQNNPTMLGAGGGGWDCGFQGGNGGGKVIINAGTLKLDGAIRANGEPPNTWGGCGWPGGGAGGAVNVTAGAVAGSGGITANGGSSGNNGGGGGGGRVRLGYSGTYTYTGSLSASGGTGTVNGGPGTVVVVNTGNGAITFPAGSYSIDGGGSYASITLSSGTTLSIRGAATVTSPIVVPAGATVVLDSSDALSKLSLASIVSGTVIVNAPVIFGSPLTIDGALRLNAPASGTSLTVGGSAVIDAKLTLSGSLTVRTGGTVTHTQGLDGFKLDVMGNIAIQAGAGIDVSGKGLAAGNLAGFGSSGATYDALTLQVASGSGQYNGGSHGGLGGMNSGATAPPAAVYGDPDNPALMGGGGGQSSGACAGGAGGGKVVINAASLQLDGFIRADGMGPVSGCAPLGGGGAGGAINLVVSTSFFGSGVVSAAGGPSGTGGGGGGRVRISSGTSTFTGSTNAGGGSGNPAGQKGTVRSISTNSNDLYVGAGVYSLKATDVYNAVFLGSGAELRILGSAKITQPIAIPAGTAVYLDSPSSLTNLSVSSTVGGTLVVNASLKDARSFNLGGTLVVNDRFEVKDLLTSSGALVTHDVGNTRMNLVVNGTFDLVVGAAVDALGRGLAPGPSAGFGARGATIDPATNVVAAGSGNQNGGSHAGLGGQNQTGQPRAAVYDYPSAPLHPGGGGGASSTNAAGGFGGGLIRVQAGTLKLNGFIRADGQSVTNNGGGGAGGTVLIGVGSLSGSTGAILAQGGSSNGGGGGGGGIILVSNVSSSYTGSTSATGGAGTPAGAAGSVTLSQSSAPPIITSTAPTAATVGDAYAYQPTATGSTPMSWTLVSGPSGAAVDANTGAFSWTPQTDGTVSATIQAANSYGSTSHTFTVNAYSKPQIISTPTLTGTVGQAYQYNAQGRAFATGTSPLTWSTTFAPTGFTIDAQTGVISWTPSSAGQQGVCIVVTNPAGNDQQCFQVTVSAPSGGTAPSITSTAASTGLVSSAYHYDADDTPSASGTTPIAWAASFAPQGFTIDSSTGLVSWNPSQAGQYAICVIAQNSVGSATQCFQVTVAAVSGQAAPVITSTPSTSGTVGTPYSYNSAGKVAASGSTPILWAALLAPQGLAIDPSTGDISWTPPAAGQAGVCIEAKNGAGTDTQCWQVNVAAAAGSAAPQITSTAAQSGAVGVPYHYDADDTAETTVVAAVGWTALLAPSGFSIDSSTGRVTWTPQTAGTVGLCIKAQNSYGQDTQCWQVQVAASVTAPSIDSTASLLGTAGQPYHYDGDDKATSLGTTPIGWSTQIAPSGFSIDATTGVVSWTPLAPGQYGICLVATNVAGKDQQCFQVTVSGSASGSAPAITSTPSTTGQEGRAYAYNAQNRATATGAGPMTWSALLAPNGFAIDPTQGTIQWTPQTWGAVGICLQAQNPYGTANQCFTVNVAPAPTAPKITSSPTLFATVGGAYKYGEDGLLTASGTAPISFAVDVGPQGLTVNAQTGAVSWSPEAGGNFAVQLSATNAAGTDVQSFNVTVLPNGQGQSAPVIVRDALPSAVLSVPYAYNEKGVARAGGTQPITWELSSGPSNLSIDRPTGAVSWTPSLPGTETITLKASNSLGSDLYTFTVKVFATPPPPPVAALKLTPPEGDAPLAITADGSRSYAAPGGLVAFYRWDFGDGSPYVFGATATHTYARPGGYVVRLLVTDSFGSTGEESARVAVTFGGKLPPVARIGASQLEGQDELEVVFACECLRGFSPIAAYRWDFGDGSSSGERTPAHAFRAGGYEVRLTVVDEEGLTATDSVLVSVSDGSREPPQLSVRADPVFGQAPLKTSLAASYRQRGGQVISVVWSLGNGTTATGPAFQATLAAPGMVLAQATATSSSGLKSTASVPLWATDGKGEVPPAILSLANGRAKLGEPYLYGSAAAPLPAAIGSRPLTWSLGAEGAGAPEGMAVDPSTGRITWTPSEAQVGEVPVALVATNALGSAKQDWIISVAGEVALPPGGDTPPKKGCGCAGATGGAMLLAWLAHLGWLARRRRR